MSEPVAISSSPGGADRDAPPARVPKRIGLVVHPTRSVDYPLALLRDWTDRHDVDVVQTPAPCSQRRVTEDGDPAQTELIVSIGGDGTTLAALRTGAMAGRPVMGIACGSLGALATVSVSEVVESLDRFSRGDWHPRRFPALALQGTERESSFALNDVALVRAGGGQIRVNASLDGTLYARLAGDGAIVSTALGSSGYAISARGPLVAPRLDGFVFTPLPTHGGFCPPLVAGSESVLELEIEPSFGGARIEIDGQVSDERVRSLTISMRHDVATMVGFSDQEPLLSGLRRRGIILDSPRIIADRSPDPGR
jgi:NAD+ kinase